MCSELVFGGANLHLCMPERSLSVDRVPAAAAANAVTTSVS